VNFELNEEQSSIRKTAKDFVDREIVPHAAEWDRTETMDKSIVGKLAEVGFLGAPLPEAYGGMGVDNVSYCTIIEELGRADSSVRGVVSVNVGLVGKTILKWGTEEQKKEWIPQLCSGAKLGCYGLTEPHSGSDAASLKSKAVRDGDDWIITGTKMFITNGTWAGLALIFARTGDDSARGISAFLVPTDLEGFSSNKVMGKLGLRSQDTGELVMDGVRVPDANRLGDEGQGFKIAMTALDTGRMSLAAGSVGIAQGCLEASIKYSTEREQFQRPIARFQLVQELIADMAVEIEAARFLTWHVATMADRGEKHTLQSSYAKYFASETAVRAANAAVQVHGGYGYIDEYPVGKYLKDARVATLYEGTSQIQKLIIGRALTGENAFT
jgi:alkylation response protein AidB-like acyl-CoA dehydrogenase